MLVVDLRVHEFELGVWKALFTHLICILSTAGTGDELLHELDCRYVSSSNLIVGRPDEAFKLPTHSNLQA
jgi:hypothetical protein